MMEPAIIGLLGVSIGGIIISLYMPLFAMIGNVYTWLARARRNINT